MVGFILLFACIYFGLNNKLPFAPVNSKSNLSSIKPLGKTYLRTKEKNTYIQDIKKSKKQLDSIFTRHNRELTRKISYDDSARSAKLGEEIYLDFLKKMNEFDNNPTKRTRKLVLLDFKIMINDSIDNKSEIVLSKYSKGSIDYIKLNKIYYTHKMESIRKINAIIYQ